MKKCTLVVLLGLIGIFTTQSLAQSTTQAITNYLTQQKENHKLGLQDVEFQVTSQHTSKVSGLTHVYFRQVVNGIPVYGSESSAHFKEDGKLLKFNNRFVAQSQEKSRGMSSPALTAAGAIRAASTALGYSPSRSFNLVDDLSTGSPKMLMSDGGVSGIDIPVELVYQKTQEGELILAWDLSIQSVIDADWWSVRVDAASGEIVDRINWTISCNLDHNHDLHDHDDHLHLDFNKNLQPAPETAAGGCTECYEVFPLPLESPLFGGRTFESGAALASASPFGWHDVDGNPGADFTTTRGNNTNTYEDGDNTGFQPDGGSDLYFGGPGYEWGIDYSFSTQYEAAAVTNLFYWTNVTHDLLHVYGFDEAAGNFQENNYGNGGIGGDSVNSEAQDGSGTCNANMSTPPDGGNARIQMYVCNRLGNFRDGSFDNLVIVHEYGHGISIRLTGGAGTSGCLGNTEQMGEGWSDWYGAVMTILPGDTGAQARGVGTYLFGEGADGGGIRPFPYSTDMNINPMTYNSISGVSIPHGVGSVWATMLWEMTWGLIDAHGFDANIYNFTGDVSLDAGNVMAMALVTEAMKIQPCSPGFVDGRDAILAADQAIYGGANECIIWDAFAKRGLGVNADQGSSFSVSDGAENFDTPSGIAAFTAPEDVCASEPEFVVEGAGSPIGGVYSGPGVTDNGDGLTYTFDPAAAGVGVHTITYTIADSACASASSDNDDIEVLAVPDSPTSVGVDDACVGEEVTVSATPVNPANSIRWFDAPTGGAFLFEGTDYTFTATEAVDLWVEETPDDFLSKLVISEVTMQTPDRLEIQNIGVQTDYSGYRVVVSEEPFVNINTVNAVTKILGVMEEDEAITWSDQAGSSDYWGSNIWWGNDPGDTGWVLILDPSGNVVDSVFWNATPAQIASFNITVAGFNITAADLDWSGAGADLTTLCSDSFQRNGDTDSAADWPNACLDETFGVANDNIGIGFAGCLSERTLTQVTIETEAPIISCPADQTEIIDGDPFTVPDYSLIATFSDNCVADPVITQVPAIGEELAPGTYTVTLTATDAAGNEADCSFTLTVEGVLAVDEFGIDNVISIYPNPSQGDLTLLNRSNATLEAVNLYDVNGRLIKRFNTNGVGAEVQFNLNDVASGMYFLQVVTDNGQTVKRVVKQ